MYSTSTSFDITFWNKYFNKFNKFLLYPSFVTCVNYFVTFSLHQNYYVINKNFIWKLSSHSCKLRKAIKAKWKWLWHWFYNIFLSEWHLVCYFILWSCSIVLYWKKLIAHKNKWSEPKQKRIVLVFFGRIKLPVVCFVKLQDVT